MAKDAAELMPDDDGRGVKVIQQGSVGGITGARESSFARRRNRDG